MLIGGGDIRGGIDYEDDSFFSMESLKNEVQEKYQVCVVELPGSVIAEGIPASHGEPNAGYLQYDDGVKIDKEGNITEIGGEPFDADKMYRAVMSLWDVKDGSSKPIMKYFKENQDKIPCEDSTWPVYSTLIGYWAK